MKGRLLSTAGRRSDPEATGEMRAEAPVPERLGGGTYSRSALTGDRPSTLRAEDLADLGELLVGRELRS